MRTRVLLAAAAAALLSITPAAGAADRYALVDGCYALKAAQSGKLVAKAGDGYAATGAGAEAFDLQATRLGEYLLFGKAGDFLSGEGGAVSVATAPSEAADWKVDVKGGLYEITLPSAGKALSVGDGGALVLADAPAAFDFVAADGCAKFPESEVNVTGTPHRGKKPWGETRGFIDPHFHWMAFEFLGGSAHCGRPWHPYGVAAALVDCPDHEPDGSGAVLENVLSNGSPYGTHDVHGWPTFAGWPRPESLTHEGSYYKWVERAWRGGLRLATVLLVDNAVLCEVYPLKRNSCDEMDSIRLQAADMRALEDYVDAQSGGPGKGWFRIVEDPFEARRVINEGKLAIVLGIETSRVFQCREFNGDHECDPTSIDAGLDEVYELGVRQMEIVNKYDNALTGVAGDSNETGLVVNQGNRYETGHYWRMQTCPEGLGEDVHDKTQPTAPPQITEDPVWNDVVGNYLPTGQAPVYPKGPHCNEAGLTDLGKHLIRRMMDKGMLFDPDHMSVAARLQALEILEDAQYSGVISSHSWSTPDAYPRIYQLGGVVTPISGRTEGFVNEWKRLKPQAAPRYYFGFGFGSDMNGLHSQPGARNPEDKVTYPFKAFDGSVVDKQRTGERTWDVNVDGVSHYGLFPDWVEDLRKVGGDEIVADMARGSEAFLQMWERATGIEGGKCKKPAAKFTSRGVGAVRLGSAPAALVRNAGQPDSRKASGFKFCVDRSAGAEVVAGVDRSGRVRVVGSTARGHRAGTIAPGDAASRLRGSARSIGRGLFVRGRFVYGVRKGRVTFVAVAPRSLIKRPAALRRALRSAGLR